MPEPDVQEPVARYRNHLGIGRKRNIGCQFFCEGSDCVISSNLPTTHPNSFPTPLWISAFVFRMSWSILASALQFRFRLDLRKRSQVVGAYFIIWSETASCQPLETTSAQSRAAFSTRLRSCSLRDEGNCLGGC